MKFKVTVILILLASCITTCKQLDSAKHKRKTEVKTENKKLKKNTVKVKAVQQQRAQKEIIGDKHPLITAAIQGNVGAVESLLIIGISLETPDSDGFTALSWAARAGREDIVKMLINAGAQVNTKSTSGVSTLMLASNGGHRKIAVILLNHGAEINAASNNGHTSLMFAAYRGHKGIVRDLVNRGADIDLRQKDGISALDYSIRNRQGRVVTILQRANKH